jgi:hypothetical protein
MVVKSFQTSILVAVGIVALAGSAQLLHHANAALTLSDSPAPMVAVSSPAVAQAPDYLPSHFALRAKEAEPLPAQF